MAHNKYIRVSKKKKFSEIKCTNKNNGYDFVGVSFNFEVS